MRAPRMQDLTPAPPNPGLERTNASVGASRPLVRSPLKPSIVGRIQEPCCEDA
jgi:hypothetical protein